jgi:hypothetical protein
MYYRGLYCLYYSGEMLINVLGANAALLLYDITSASTFDDIRGWLEGTRDLDFYFLDLTPRFPTELKKNCPPELIIYIVGSKTDLYRHRQVTSDLARLSLHTWFPPPRPPTPPPPPPPQPSTLSYIRPRFTSFPGIRSPPTSPLAQSSHETPAYLDLPPNRSSALNRSKTTTATHPRPTGGSSLLTRCNTAAGTRTPQPSRGSHFGIQAGGWNEIVETSSTSLNEDDEDAVEEEDREWGLSKGMELFEVSAKDDLGKSL